MENNLSIVKDQFIELPNNIEAEQAVIGSILVSNDIFDEISTIISKINLSNNGGLTNPSEWSPGRDDRVVCGQVPCEGRDILVLVR